MKRPKPRPEPKRLADLPGAAITCFYCREPKPPAGAVRYRAHQVCAGCAAKLNSLKEKEKS